MAERLPLTCVPGFQRFHSGSSIREFPVKEVDSLKEAEYPAGRLLPTLSRGFDEWADMPERYHCTFPAPVLFVPTALIQQTPVG